MSNQMVDEYMQSMRQGNNTDKAAAFIADHIAIDGEHHKTWVLDQVVRMLVNPERYSMLRTIYEYETGYEWPEGIAP